MATGMSESAETLLDDSKCKQTNSEKSDPSELNLWKDDTEPIGDQQNTIHTPEVKSTNQKTNTDEDEVVRKMKYLKFQEYDFSDDTTFQRGWDMLSPIVPIEKKEQQLLKTKLFYYSRHIETLHSLDVNDYLKWKDQDALLEEKEHRRSTTNEDAISSNATAEDESGGESSLSFGDIIELIQSGKTIPGVKKIEVKPTLTDPSPSTMQRKLKPWES